MNRTEVENLLDKYREGRCTKEEMALLEDQIFNAAGKPVLTEQEITGVKDEIRINLISIVQPPIVQSSISTVKSGRLWPKIAAAAAAVAAITLGVWLYDANHTHRHPEPVSGSLYANNIAPGSNKATLTLASGKVITLDTNKTSVVVADSVKAMTMLTAATPRGGMYQVTLSDGTRVWLNADSKISFPSRFSGKERKILLTGEAYFEVAKNKRKPFVVVTNRQKIEVLGTHFNVNAYKDETIMKTTLLEGSVKIDEAGISKVLIPGTQACSAFDGLKILTVDINDVTDWKNGDFIFRQESLESIMRKVSRWYNVAVNYSPGVDTQQTFSGYVSRSKNITAVLSIMESTKQVKFKIEEKRISVMRWDHP